MISAYEVGQMSDEEIARILNDYWSMILGLVLQQGGQTYVDKEVIARAVLDDYQIMTWEDYAAWRLILRAEKKNADGTV